MQGSILVHDLRKVITLVDMLRDIGLDKKLSLPKVVVLGNQSSGKSSLLEQIVGLDFLPRGSGVVTRRPLELRMNNITELKTPYAEFDEIVEGSKKKKFSNFAQVKKSIEDLTDKICGSKQNIIDKPIVLNFFSSTCPNLTIVDLPGITSNPVGDQPPNIYEITKQMALRYIKEKRSIILCVIPANQDLSTSEALKIMMQVDPAGQRSIGCLTKIDIMDRGNDATKILKNQEIALRYGYVGIKCRCQEDINNKIPVSQSIKEQAKFFTKSPIYSTLSPENFGTQSLTRKLTTILYQQIKSSMPQIFEEIKNKKREAQDELQKLGPGVTNTDEQMVNYAWKSVSLFLKIFKNSMSGIKSNEINTDPISSKIRQDLSALYKEEYDESATKDITDKDIEKAMFSFPGFTIPGFPSIDAFLALLSPLMKKLQSPAFSINNTIHQSMEQQADSIINKVMVEKYPEFKNRFIQLVHRVLDKHRKELQTFLSNLMDAQLNYLYTNNRQYLQGNFTLTQKEKKKMQNGKIKDPLIFQLRKRINAYYKLVVRNLRDLVPKQVFYFLTFKATRQLEFEAFQFTSDVKLLFQWLTEPGDVIRRRTECIKAIKIYQESEKKIRMDPEISRLIRSNSKQSKYYKKFGMKTPEQMQDERIIKQNTASQLVTEQTIKRKQEHIKAELKGKGEVIHKGQKLPTVQPTASITTNVHLQQRPTTTGDSMKQQNKSNSQEVNEVNQPPPPSADVNKAHVNKLFGVNLKDTDKNINTQKTQASNPQSQPNNDFDKFFGNQAPKATKTNQTNSSPKPPKTEEDKKKDGKFNLNKQFGL